jgi:hypothetical protein
VEDTKNVSKYMVNFFDKVIPSFEDKSNDFTKNEIMQMKYYTA